MQVSKIPQYPCYKEGLKKAASSHVITLTNRLNHALRLNMLIFHVSRLYMFMYYINIMVTRAVVVMIVR